eukprot:750573-Hanusia_phi.AAC.1
MLGGQKLLRADHDTLPVRPEPAPDLPQGISVRLVAARRADPETVTLTFEQQPRARRETLKLRRGINSPSVQLARRIQHPGLVEATPSRGNRGSQLLITSFKYHHISRPSCKRFRSSGS